MNEETNKKASTKLSLDKSVATIITILIFFFLYFIAYIFIVLMPFDNILSGVITILCLISFPIIIIFSIWNKKYNKIMAILLILFFLLLIGNTFYYTNHSMKVESLIHLHNRYNFPYSDMKVIGATPRSATVSYNGIDIYVYYDNGWKNDYLQKTKANTKSVDANSSAHITDFTSMLDSTVKNEVAPIVDLYSSTHIKDFTSILGSYTSNFKVVLNQISDSYSYEYLIYLYTSDETIAENAINKLNNYVSNSDSCNIFYCLCITKEKDFYNELANANVSNIHVKDYSSLFVEYMPVSIKTYNDFDKSIFINNGNNSINTDNNIHVIYYYYHDKLSSVFKVFNVVKNPY